MLQYNAKDEGNKEYCNVARPQELYCGFISEEFPLLFFIYKQSCQTKATLHNYNEKSRFNPLPASKVSKLHCFFALWKAAPPGNPVHYKCQICTLIAVLVDLCVSDKTTVNHYQKAE